MNARERILKTLKDFGRLPISKLGAICSISYQQTKKVLEGLKKEGKVKETKETIATYVELAE